MYTKVRGQKYIISQNNGNYLSSLVDILCNPLEISHISKFKWTTPNTWCNTMMCHKLCLQVFEGLSATYFVCGQLTYPSELKILQYPPEMEILVFWQHSYQSNHIVCGTFICMCNFMLVSTLHILCYCSGTIVLQ